MFDGSKILKIFRICITIILILVFILIVILFNRCSKSIENVSIEETIQETQEKIVFDLKLPPNKQKNLKNHTDEYMQQVYEYLFPDIKIRNMIKDTRLSYGELKERGNLNNFYDWVLSWIDESEVFKYLFARDIEFKIPLKDLPVTDNYINNHPKSLFNEFNIKKENYKSKTYYPQDADFDYWYEFSYNYDVEVEEKNKLIVVENKTVDMLRKERETGKEGVGIVRDKNADEAPVYVNTRKFYFTYTLDEKGYVDDIKYDRTEIINDDKYLDNLIKYE